MLVPLNEFEGSARIGGRGITDRSGSRESWVLPERKTGINHAEAITARLVPDERGWLRLAG